MLLNRKLNLSMTLGCVSLSISFLENVDRAHLKSVLLLPAQRLSACLFVGGKVNVLSKTIKEYCLNIMMRVCHVYGLLVGL